jgi:hypothetical protein
VKELTCPNCPGVITATARKAALDKMEKGHGRGLYTPYRASEVAIKCPTCAAQLVVKIEWKPVPVDVTIVLGEHE